MGNGGKLSVGGLLGFFSSSFFDVVVANCPYKAAAAEEEEEEEAALYCGISSAIFLNFTNILL